MYLFHLSSFCVTIAAIPSIRARDCSKNEKEALNYLFLLVPLLNVAIPFFLKSFAVVWSADTVAFFGMYAWKVSLTFQICSLVFLICYRVHDIYNLYFADGVATENREMISSFQTCLVHILPSNQFSKCRESDKSRHVQQILSIGLTIVQAKRRI